MDAAKPLSDLNVRKAIDLAIDRNALVTALDGGTATRSLFPVHTPPQGMFSLGCVSHTGAA